MLLRNDVEPRECGASGAIALTMNECLDIEEELTASVVWWNYLEQWPEVRAMVSPNSVAAWRRNKERAAALLVKLSEMRKAAA